MHRTIRNSSRLTKVVRTVGITVGIVAGSASAASAVNGGSFVPTFLSEPTTATAPSVATTTPRKGPEPTPTTTAAPTTTKAPEPTTAKVVEPTPTTAKVPTPTTAKAPEPTPTTKAPTPATTKVPEPTTAKAPEPTTTPTTKVPEPTATTKAPEVRTPESLQLSCERKTDGTRASVVCSWTGDLPAGGTTFMLLRGGGGAGRVLVSGPNAHSFVDSTIEPGVAYSYTAVVPRAPGSPTLAHSNPVSISG